MSKDFKYGKILAVIFLTILIWVWTDRALDEEYTVSGASISVAKSAEMEFWVRFDSESNISLKKIVFQGSGDRVAKARRKIKDGRMSLDFILYPEQQELLTAPGEHLWDVLEFLRRDQKIKDLGLGVLSCEPKTVTINVVELSKAVLDVRCVDEEGVEVKTTGIDPSQIQMYVPTDWQGEKLVADVLLSRREIEQARLAAVEKTPFVELAAGHIKKAATTVKITTSQDEDLRSDYTITTARLGFLLSANLQGKYKVEVENLPEVIRAITVRATPEAKRAYDKMRYQMLLEIDDADKDSEPDESLRREVEYNFPQEYVRTDEIALLDKQPVMARFKLIALPSPVSPVTPIGP